VRQITFPHSARSLGGKYQRSARTHPECGQGASGEPTELRTRETDWIALPPETTGQG